MSINKELDILNKLNEGLGIEEEDNTSDNTSTEDINEGKEVPGTSNDVDTAKPDKKMTMENDVVYVCTECKQSIVFEDTIEGNKCPVCKAKGSLVPVGPIYVEGAENVTNATVNTHNVTITNEGEEVGEEGEALTEGAKSGNTFVVQVGYKALGLAKDAEDSEGVKALTDIAKKAKVKGDISVIDDGVVGVEFNDLKSAQQGFKALAKVVDLGNGKDAILEFDTDDYEVGTHNVNESLGINESASTDNTFVVYLDYATLNIDPKTKESDLKKAVVTALKSAGVTDGVVVLPGKGMEDPAVKFNDFKSAQQCFKKLDKKFDMGSAKDAIAEWNSNDEEVQMHDANESLDMNEASKKVVRGGKLVTVKVKKGKKKKLTAKQKAALMKARKKSHTGSADKARAKSMKVRSKRMKESIESLFNESVEPMDEGVAILITSDDLMNESVDVKGLSTELGFDKDLEGMPARVINESVLVLDESLESYEDVVVYGFDKEGERLTESQLLESLNAIEGLEVDSNFSKADESAEDSVDNDPISSAMTESDNINEGADPEEPSEVLVGFFDNGELVDIEDDEDFENEVFETLGEANIDPVDTEDGALEFESESQANSAIKVLSPLAKAVGYTVGLVNFEYED